MPDDVADVLSFSEGGNDPCDGEGPEPYTFLVALPSYEEVSKIERGWDTVLCAGTDAGSLEHLLITSPDEKTLIDEDAPGDPEATATIPIGGGADKQSAGEITVSWSSASISAFPLLSSELGEYTIAARINGEDFERKFEVSHASTGRVYVVGAPQVGTVGPGDIEVQLFGYDPENGVDLDLYTSGSSEDDGVPYRFAHRSNIAVSEQGEARVILDRDGLEPGCWAVLANAPSASDFASDGPDSVPGVMYFDTYKDLFCIPDD